MVGLRLLAEDLERDFAAGDVVEGGVHDPERAPSDPGQDGVPVVEAGAEVELVGLHRMLRTAR